MSQPDLHPHHVSLLLEPAMGEIVHALADRPGRSKAAYDAKAEETWTLIESFLPRDIIDLMLVGQLVAFNDVFADATHDVLRGMVDTMKQRTQSGLIAMGRLTQGHVDRLAKRGCQPYQTAATIPLPAQRPAQAASAEGAPVEVSGAPTPDRATGAEVPERSARTAVPERPAGTKVPRQPPVPGASAIPPPGAALSGSGPTSGAAAVRATSLDIQAAPTGVATEPPRPAPAPSASAPWDPTQSAVGPRVEETSWLDEPYQEYLIETPGYLAARETAAKTAAALALVEATHHGNGAEPLPANAIGESLATRRGNGAEQ